MFCGIDQRAYFGNQNTLMTSINPQQNAQMRVMSTPTWPVPYYQRAFRDPANVEKSEGALGHICYPVKDQNVVMAKELLMIEGKGYVVEAIEQHYDIKDYRTSFESSAEFSHAYVDDLLDCLGVAQAENRRLLAENDFADVFN